MTMSRSVVLSMLLAGGLALSAANPTLEAVPRTDWAKDLSASLTARAAQQQDIPLMFLGDSITMCWEYASDHQYPGGKNAWERYFKPLGAVNYGVSGDRVEHVLWRITTGRQLECRPKVIVLLIGTNNFATKTSATDLAAGIENLLAVIRAALPETKILALGILPRQGNYPIAEVNRLLAEAAPRHGADFLDVGQTLLLGRATVSRAVFRDGLHLSPAGYELFAQTLLLPVKRLMGLAPAERGRRDDIVGLVYETEEWSEPKDAWRVDQGGDNIWTLWTTEPDSWIKRSWGQTLRTPASIKADRATPEEGAPPLHTRLTDIPVGGYQIFVSGPNRNIALSLDGKNWTKHSGGEISLGFWNITDGVFEVWADDRYATPGNTGPSYYDYIRLAPAEAPEMQHVAVFTRPDGTTQISWLTTATTPSAEFRFGRQGAAMDNVVKEDEANLRNHAIILEGLTPGVTYEGKIVCQLNQQTAMASAPIVFVAGQRPQPPATTPQRIELRVHEPVKPRQAWPVTSGVPFAKGMLASADDARLVDADGQTVVSQRTVTATWPDGSVKWLTVDFLATTAADRDVVYVLETGRGLGLQILMEKPWDAVVSAPIATASQLRLVDGRVLNAATPADAYALIERGPNKLTYQASGVYAGEGEAMFGWRGEQTVYAGQHRLRRHRWYVVNTHKAEGHLLVKSLSWQPAGWTASAPSLSNGVAGSRLDLRQDWSQRAALTVDGKASNLERGDGFLRLGTARALWVRDFWQTWPKGLSASAEGTAVMILPELPEGYPGKDFETVNHLFEHFYWYRDGGYMFRRGMENMTEVWTCEAPADGRAVDADLAQWLAHPLFAAASPEYYCATGAFGAITPSRPGQFIAYEKALDQSFANLEKGRQQRQEYGWMNFGDWYGERRWNWGNNEYDMSYVCAVNFARLGRLDFLRRGEEMARHYTTTDFIAWPWDSGLRERMYEHCVGHIGGFLAKNDPRFADVNMTGFVQPLIDNSGGHSFQPGNFYYGCLLGEPRFFEVGEIACRAQARTFTRNFRITIERAPGWALTNAMNAYIFTHDPYYLNAARVYVAKIREMQNPVTGCLDLPQDQSECDCPDKRAHRGGKAFATGVMLHGLSLYHQFGDPADAEMTREVIVRCADWLLDHAWDRDNYGFRYKTGCPKYAVGRGFTLIVTEGIAYAGVISGNPRYLEFLKTYAGRPLARAVSGSGYSSGKGFSSPHRQVPHLLKLLLDQGVTDLEDLVHQAAVSKPWVFLDRSGQGVLRYEVWNPRAAEQDCTLTVTGTPGLNATPAQVSWKASAGRSQAPIINVQWTGAADAANLELTLKLKLGGYDSEAKVAALPAAPLPTIGKRLGFVGGDNHFTLAALRQAGGQPELIADINKADWSGFGCVMIGGDSLRVTTPMLTPAGAVRLRAFAEAGGKVLFWQLNDTNWLPDAFGPRLVMEEPSGTAAAILMSNHPLLAGVQSLAGAICYDTITLVEPPWQVLAEDNSKGPSVAALRLGQGEVIVFNPSVDREFHPTTSKDIGLDLETCRKIIANALQWAK
ncbi:MAG: GDSL-like Lipase/Acylhydrolase [Lentisphaerae bacterium ADurb.Bin082]|nr:MAG: GDSL-like Lipase/Acylhydrolase [Lentisphaerae bacterium ADurb.Bin082]